MANIDPNTIGQDRPVQDPADALKQAQGTYRDGAQELSIQEKVDFLPKGPDPQPFTLTGGASGARGEGG